MAGNLDREESVSSLLHRALASGEWREYKDDGGRSVYFNECTREATQDLRTLLLERWSWGAAGAPVVGLPRIVGGGATDDSSCETEVVIAALRRELADAMATVHQYELEVEQLRLCLFGVPGYVERAAKASAVSAAAESTKPPLSPQQYVPAPPPQGPNDPPRLFNTVPPVQLPPAVSGLVPDAPPASAVVDEEPSSSVQAGADAAQRVAVLERQLAAARRSAAILLDRVSTDRQQQGLCAGCLASLATPAAVLDGASVLASERIRYPRSVTARPRPVDTAVVRAAAVAAERPGLATVQSTAAMRLGGTSPPPIATLAASSTSVSGVPRGGNAVYDPSAAPSLGYLPSSWVERQPAGTPGARHGPLSWNGVRNDRTPPPPPKREGGSAGATRPEYRESDPHRHHHHQRGGGGGGGGGLWSSSFSWSAPPRKVDRSIPTTLLL